VGVAALIVVAAIGFWLTTRGSSTAQSSPPAAASPTMANPLLQALTRTNEVGTGKGMLPPSSCHAQSASLVTCSHPALAINSASFRTFPSLNALYSAYKATVKSLGQNPFRTNFGDCTSRLTSGEVSWNHNYQHPRRYSLDQLRSPGFPDDKAAGRVFCTFMNSQLYMVWTQNDGHMLGRLNGSPHDTAWLWWHGVHHSIDIPGSQQVSM